jgi:hypothetical protein
MNGAWFYIDVVVTPFLRPWKIVTISTLKQTNLFATFVLIMLPNLTRLPQEA